ncbi:MAG: hypothetical protein ACRCY3_13115 [Sphingorhabdus sp.]
MEPQKPRNLVFPGGVGTAVYLLAILIYAISARNALLNMTPNEFGDFLAGCFAPLAFFWLVLGFFQQGDELRNSVAALHLQGEELRNSVEQQRQLVDVTREQLGLDRAVRDAAADEAARKAAPIFHIAGGFSMWSSPTVTSKFIIRNVGAECRNVTITDSDGFNHAIPLFKNDSGIELEYQLKNDAIAEPVDVKIKCICTLGRQHIFQTTLEPVRGQYGPEYRVTNETGLFAQVLEVGTVIGREAVPER